MSSKSLAIKTTLTGLLALALLTPPTVDPLSAAEAPADSVLVDNNTTGYYNDALGTLLDGTQLQFPPANSYGGKDPTILRAPEPDLSSVATVLGGWLSASPLPLNANWSALQAIPLSWSANRENAIVYPVSVGPQGYSRVVGNFGVDNGLYVWVNGRYKFGAMGPGAVGGFEYADVNLGSLPPGQNFIQILREDHGDFGGFTVLITGTTDTAGGQITYPPENTLLDPGTLPLRANAWSNTGSGVNHVEFFVFYDHAWHAAGLDANAPYEVFWLPPSQLHTQILKVRIDVVDNSGGRVDFADVVSGIDYREYLYDTGVVQNWVPFRVYLNQRILDDAYGDGDVKCSVASMAMVLAMNSLIDWDTATLKTKANEMWPRVRVPVTGGYAGDIGKMKYELNANQGMTAELHWTTTNASAWFMLKEQIDAGHPLILGTKKGVVTLDGHFIVAVGYREKDALHEVIAYDPFGEWTGTCCYPLRGYNANTADDPLSYRGQWVYYNFDQVYNGAVITAQPAVSHAGLVSAAGAPTTRPDLVSDEPENLEAYRGTPVAGGPSIYLPLIQR